MPYKSPWTREELNELIVNIEKAADKIEDEEAEFGNDIKPVPPLTKQEALDYLNSIIDIGSNRILTRQECFIHGQLLAQFEQSIIAEHLGKKGRYYVIPEEKVMEYGLRSKEIQ